MKLSYVELVEKWRAKAVTCDAEEWFTEAGAYRRCADDLEATFSRVAQLGDLVRYKVQYLRDGYKAPEPWAPPTEADLIDADSQGIIIELREDGYFVQEHAVNLGEVGDGKFLTRTHSTLVPFDGILAVIAQAQSDHSA